MYIGVGAVVLILVVVLLVMALRTRDPNLTDHQR